MSTQLQFSAGLHNVGRFDFTYKIPNGEGMSERECVIMSNIMKNNLVTQWDTFDEIKFDSIEQVLGRCLMSLNEDDVANTDFQVDLFWCLEEEYAREVAEVMGVEITDDFHPEAWVEFNVEFHSALSGGFNYGAKQVEKDSPTGPNANYKGRDLFNSIRPEDEDWCSGCSDCDKEDLI